LLPQFHLNPAKDGQELSQWILIHLQKAYKNLGYKKGDFPVSEKLSKEILSIPMFPQLEKIEQTRIIKVVNSFK